MQRAGVLGGVDPASVAGNMQSVCGFKVAADGGLCDAEDPSGSCHVLRFDQRANRPDLAHVNSQYESASPLVFVMT